MNAEPPILLEEITDPIQLAEARARQERLERNWAWFEKRAADIYRRNRGQCISVAAEQLFVADTAEEALALAKAAHPGDDGRFTRYVPREKVARIYAHQGQGSG